MRTRLLASALLLALAACDTTTTGQHGSDLIATTISDWSFQEVAAFGGAMPDEGYLVNGVGNVVQAADGRVFVLNANDRRIAVYDSAGTWLGDVGAIGNGPGGVLFGDGAEPKLEQLAIDGSRSTLIHDPNLRASPVTEEDRTAYLAEKMLDAGSVQFPATRPYYSSVLAGSDGTVWLLLGDNRWAVYAADGRGRGDVVPPKGTQIVGVGDRAVYAVTHDSLGVETLRFFRIATSE